MSNVFAIFLQSLCVKLGTVTGMNLAENCRAHLPRWLNIVLYIFAESAIIATDIAEVGPPKSASYFFRRSASASARSRIRRLLKQADLAQTVMILANRYSR